MFIIFIIIIIIIIFFIIIIITIIIIIIIIINIFIIIITFLLIIKILLSLLISNFIRNTNLFLHYLFMLYYNGINHCKFFPIFHYIMLVSICIKKCRYFDIVIDHKIFNYFLIDKYHFCFNLLLPWPISIDYCIPNLSLGLFRLLD